MPSKKVLEALHDVEAAAGRDLPSWLRARLKASPEFGSYREGVADLDEVLSEMDAWEHEHQDAARVVVRDEVDHSVEPRELLTDAERAYWRAATAVAYSMATDDPEVTAFRSEVLGGVLVPLEELGEWIASRREAEGPPYSDCLLEFPGADDGSVRRLPVTEGADLERLGGLAKRLARSGGWQPAQATAFVLCDAVPLVSLLRVTDHHSSAPGPDYVTLRVAVELSPETVARAYSKARALRVGRPLSAPVWQAVEFAAWRPRRSWARLWREWSSSDVRYRSARAFANAVRSGARRLGVVWSP